jgi:F-type H+-transporting ATPase subunit delta
MISKPALSQSDREQTEGKVETAVALTRDEMADVSASIDKLMGHPVKLQYEVRPDILGGLRITVGDWVLDTTLSGQLDELKANLL